MTITTVNVITGEVTTREMMPEEIAALPQVTPEQLATQIRSERDAKLAACDWTQVADAPVDQAAWASYRQALRDITEQSGFPETVEWPTQP